MSNLNSVDLFENLVYVRYLDHVLFKHSNPFQHSPLEREAVGWLVKEDDRAIWIIADRNAESLPNQVDNGSGLIILKSDVLEMKNLCHKLDVKYSSDNNDTCRVCASRKRSEKLDPPKIGGGKLAKTKQHQRSTKTIATET